MSPTPAPPRGADATSDSAARAAGSAPGRAPDAEVDGHMAPLATNPHKGHTGINRILRATGHSARGLAQAWRYESAFRQEAVLALLLAPWAFWLGHSWFERSLLLGTLLLVLIVELLNSGIEAAIDRISFEHHELSGRAKDMGSAAVLLSLLLCGATWGGALWSRLA